MFDLDGTLVDSVSQHVLAWREALEQAGSGIMAEEAKSLGRPISTEMPQEVYDFMNLFPQPTRTRPAVEYVPAPYPATRDRAA